MLFKKKYIAIEEFEIDGVWYEREVVVDKKTYKKLQKEEAKLRKSKAFQAGVFIDTMNQFKD